MWLCAVACLLLPMWSTLSNAEEPKIFCYYNSLAITKIGYASLETSEIDSTLCTHLIYAFVGITEDGDVRILDAGVDLPDNGGKAGFKKFNALRKQNERLKTLVSTGYWDEGSMAYLEVIADVGLRSKYVKNVVDFLLRYEFDGFDILWRVPNIRKCSLDDAGNFNVRYVRHSKNCAKFWICHKIDGDEDDFDAEPFSCGNRLYFDTRRSICRSKDLVECN